MSHFSGLVISNDIEERLRPYDEQDEEFFTEHRRDDVVKLYFSHKTDELFIKEYPNESDRNIFNFCQWYFGAKPITTYTERLRAKRDKKRHSYFIKSEDNNSFVLEGVYEYYNDLAKYDYYCKDGGRFADDRIIYKDGNKHNNIMSNLDVDAMIKKAKEDMQKDYLEIRDLFLAHTNKKYSIREDGSFLPHFIHWEDYAKKVEDGVLTIDDARIQYNEQDTIKEWNEVLKSSYFLLDVEDYDCSLEEYSNNATLPFYVIVDNDGWHERGEMGWFGMSSNEKDSKEWLAEQVAILRKNIQENPNTEIVLCDFHI